VSLTPPPPLSLPGAALPSAARPSVSAALKTAVTGPLAPVIALLTAVTSAIGAWQAYQDSQQVARKSYETLKVASETQAAQLEALRKNQLELRTWVEELSSIAQRRQASTEKAITRKVTKASAPSLPAPPVEPAPKAPPPPATTAPASLPPFELLDR
jgi:hypothetical protein